MSQHFSPKTVSNGLIYCSDPGNSKSFRGIGGTNIATNIGSGSNFIGTYITFIYGTEKVNIPALGSTTAVSVYYYNDYPNSGNCCPAILTFSSLAAVSPALHTHLPLSTNL